MDEADEASILCIKPPGEQIAAIQGQAERAAASFFITGIVNRSPACCKMPLITDREWRLESRLVDLLQDGEALLQSSD